ncbi:NAD(P)H-dependent oxidoreductase [Burkholderia thailandensis]|uniref:FMN-dependent NADH-azoreductase n=1 Tax=Burkholderia thailandensis TaxID=57975 RepID=UPI00192DFC11|nr:NAD(P)H-dependent oxidoreductase [Burkholderia thailandensis]MBS2127064.1 NAD(P)H-dependent oxidoreductase [Burkholderia thailandensis]QRA12485.1 NAD(P)H-dependent oxidoreductase [Burkholderia thailandensis]
MEVPANQRGKSGAHLLHIVGSPRKEGISASIDVAERFIEAWMSQDASRTVYTLDVWKTQLPSFNGAALEAKYASLAGIEMSGEAAKVWGRISEMGELFHAADVIVMGAPMWNFGIPYRLKHLIDAVTQKNVLYKFDGQNLIGTLVGRKLVVVAARGASLGGDYPEKDFDHQLAYLRTWARMVGITDVHSIVVEGTLFGPEADAAARGPARESARNLGRSL